MSNVARVVSGSPADNAGIVPGDIVLEFAGKTINNIEGLVEEIQKIKVGEKVEILILFETLRGELSK